MPEEKRTIHVLKDEKLGVDREYVAVNRNAEVGEKIYTLVDGGGYFVEGEYGDVHDVGSDDVRAKFESNYDNERWFINHEKYHVLEPTDIVLIDGERYRLEDRKAEVGERVIHVNKESGETNGIVTEATMVGVSEIEVRAYEDFDGDIIEGLSHGYYYVLTPVQDDTEPKESDVITVLANLGAEVAELKRKNEQFEQALGWNEMGPGHIPNLRNGLSELKSVVSVLEEKYETELERMQAEINALHEDNIRLGEQIATLTADIGGKTELNGLFIAELLIGLKKAGL
ncbi:hypothetical protein [Bacillus pumilus]|jgi:hypothetical protein|uniref:hypothetical protein n=1 Tax=Bacillus pumilus TaxID=1408 RepID=UPI00081F7759|nr:hypothetical protein [Bacillus pumilus]AOC55307.1 hypothetical protein BEN31_00150 [Bacillus pumilus]MBR0588524.1 hypothetical protein [Bacillus pumilus DW2J2]MBR0618436.1 hypothetical protein [Bacillus pumilus]MBR0624731.1 hypothetical protein [Bacillus pumilus]MCY7724089.1 hypothetical protein [Bacillus pumilus]